MRVARPVLRGRGDDNIISLPNQVGCDRSHKTPRGTPPVEGGSVLDLHFLGLNPQAKFIAIDEQTDHNVMHLDRLGKADCLAHQAFDPGAQRQVLPLYFLRVAFARLVLIRLEMTRVGAPVVRIIPRDAKRFQQGFELENTSSLRRPKTYART